MDRTGTLMPPKPAVIRKRREARNLSRAAAAALVYKSARTWEKWEQGLSEMDPAYWELFVIKSGGIA